MPFIVLDPKSLDVEVVASWTPEGVAISTDPRDLDFGSDELAKTAYFTGVYGYHRQHLDRDSRDSKFALVWPDPWLLAIVAVMWEGLLQGLTWDLTKAAVLRAIDALREKKLAPDKSVAARRRSTATKASVKTGFSWTQFSEDGEPLRELFFGLKASFDRQSEIERVHVTRPHEFERLRDEETDRRIEEAKKRGERLTVIRAAKRKAPPSHLHKKKPKTPKLRK